MSLLNKEYIHKRGKFASRLKHHRHRLAFSCSGAFVKTSRKIKDN